MDNDTCYVGKVLVDDTQDIHSEADPAREVLKSQLPEGTRVIREGDFVTMDFDPERLNLYINDESVITRQRHG